MVATISLAGAQAAAMRCDEDVSETVVMPGDLLGERRVPTQPHPYTLAEVGDMEDVGPFSGVRGCGQGIARVQSKSLLTESFMVSNC